MIDTILIDALTPECRIAALGNSRLIDLRIYRPGNGVRAGDVILGRVKAVVPSIRGAFLDIGDERDGFLPFPEKAARSPVQEGAAVIVQVRHEAMAEKGARLTSRVSLSDRFAVYTPDQPGINVSRKGSDPDLANRMAEAVAAEVEPGDGAIVRTAALLLGADGVDRVVSNLSALRDTWLDARALCAQVKPPHCLIAAPDPVLQTLQGIDAARIQRIVVQGIDVFLHVKDYLERSEPALLGCLEQYRGAEELFEAESVEAEIDAALSPRVPLPSGGCLYIHETPACITVDVDTDSASRGNGGKGGDLVRRTNEEAADMLVHALRLRNLSGNIVVDFISNRDREAGRALLDRLNSASSNDPVPIEVAGFTRLGLVELTRRRRTMSLSDILMDRSEAFVTSTDTHKAAITLAYEALRRLHHAAAGKPGSPLTIRSNGDVIALFRGNLKSALEDATARVGVSVALEADDIMPRGIVDVYGA